MRPISPALVFALLATGLATSLTGLPAPAAEKLALLAGGSGEDAPDNFLVQDLRDLSSRLKARGWKVRVAAGPKDYLIPGSLRGTNANVLKALREVAAGVTPGDELLVVVHSHGREREVAWGQQSHSIVSEDKDPSGAEPGLDLDAFGPPLDQAAALGAQVALVDLSCYSGSTQSLLHATNSCTATLAAPTYVSLCSGRPEERSFSSHFLDLPKPGTAISLEEQFLAARRADLESVNLPEISSRETPSAEAWDKLLTTVDPLDVYEDLKNFRAGPKPYDPKALLAGVAEGPLKLKLKTHLKDLLATRARLEKAAGGMASAYDDRTLDLKIRGRDPFKISAGNLSELLDRAAKPGDLDGYSDAQRNLIAQLKKDPSPTKAAPVAKALAEFQTRKQEFEKDTDTLAVQIGQTMDIERKLYDEQGHPVSDPTKASACRAFSL